MNDRREKEWEFPYGDILHLSRPASRIHPPMSRLDRAAQFSPFAALTGYDAAICEASRVTEKKRELDERTQERLNQILIWLDQNRPDGILQVTYFQSEKQGEKGTYQKAEGVFQKLDWDRKKLHLDNGLQILWEDIFDLHWQKNWEKK